MTYITFKLVKFPIEFGIVPIKLLPFKYLNN